MDVNGSSVITDSQRRCKGDTLGFMHACLIAGSVVLSLMTALWICSLVLKDASIVDRFWGAGFVFVAWAIAAVSPGLSLDQNLLVLIVSIWGLRLSIYIHLRNKGHPEDYRYQEMRKNHGARFWWYSYLSVFLLQGTLMLIVSLPVIYTLSFADPKAAGLSVFSIIGSLIWIIGFIFESGGDWQLARFKRDPANKGKLLTTGLWSLTRHPNYFGDACQWWGFGLFAWSHGLWGVGTFIGPVVMTLFIRKVSGVDLLEKSMKGQKPGYEDYMANVPPFFPKISRLWGASIVFCLLAASHGTQGLATEIDYKQELPFSRIDFTVKDLKSGKEIAWGEESIVYDSGTITKATLYYPPGTERKVLQEETSKVALASLEVKEYLLSNKASGEKATVEMISKTATVSYQEKPADKPKTMSYEWTPQSIIGKTLHHYIVRYWDKIIAGKAPDFNLLVPMKMDHFMFRTRLKSADQVDGKNLYVISLEPASWAIRNFVPQMDFNYRIVDGAPLLVSYVGATTITIDGDDKRLVTINFSYTK